MSGDTPAAINIEALTRLDLKPDEILAVTVGWPNLTPVQLEQYGEFIADWLDQHNTPVAGVLILPQGSSLAAIPPPTEDAPSVVLPSNWGGLNHAEIREALESAAAIKHLTEQR